MLLLILSQNENHKYWCSVTGDTIQEQREKHEKDVFTIWLDNKTKIETRTFKTISSASDVQLLSAVFQPH